MEDKRGISPLIATLLLIAFTVALGVMILHLGSNIVDEVTECEEVQMEIPTIEGQPALCYDETAHVVKVVLKNTGNVDIGKITFGSIDADLQLIQQDIPDSALDVGAVIKKEVAYTISDTFTIELTPSIETAGEQVACPDQVVKIEDMIACSS